MVEETTEGLKLMMMMRMGEMVPKAGGVDCLIGISDAMLQDVSWRVLERLDVG